MASDTQGAGDYRSGETKPFKKPDLNDEKQMDHTDDGETDSDKKMEQLRRAKKNEEKHMTQDKEHLKQDEEHLAQDEERLEQDKERLKEIDDELKKAQSKCGKRGK